MKFKIEIPDFEVSLPPKYEFSTEFTRFSQELPKLAELLIKRNKGKDCFDILEIVFNEIKQQSTKERDRIEEYSQHKGNMISMTDGKNRQTLNEAENILEMHQALLNEANQEHERYHADSKEEAKNEKAEEADAPAPKSEERVSANTVKTKKSKNVKKNPDLRYG